MYKKPAAFSMLEVMVVVVVLFVLGITVVPKIIAARGDASISSTAEDLKLIAQALSYYQAVHGIYPPNSSRVKSSKLMEPYFKGFQPFEIRTPIGGVFDYEKGSGSKSVSIMIVDELDNKFNRTQAQELDEYMDDGELSSGWVKLVNGQLRYRFAESPSKSKGG